MKSDYRMMMGQIEEKIPYLQEVFDVVRILDAETMRPVEEDGTESFCECYDFWKRHHRCTNCVSKLAIQQKAIRTKLEFLDTKMYLVIARYLELDGKPYVMEMIRHLDEDFLIDTEGSAKLVSRLTGYTEKLYEDVLTGAYNRRYYEEEIKKIDISNMGIAVIDLDDFKIYNDVYGHHVGDVALVEASRVIRNCIGAEDVLIRYGGDEFLLVLPETDPKGQLDKLRRIQKEIHKTNVPGYTGLQLSVSIGGVISTHESMEDAVARADRLMYQAKNCKNMVVTEQTLLENGEVSRSAEHNKQQVLIVDDSEVNRELLSKMLGDEYHIIEAENGTECMEILKQQGSAISVVLLDIIMPVMNGFEVLEKMNNNHWIEDIPVIMISSEDSDAVIRRAYEMGISDYISRPFDARVVYQRVQNTIKLYAKQRKLVSLVTEHINEKEKNNNMMIGILSHIVEFRNGESGLHTIHINQIIRMLLEKLIQKTDKYPSLWEERELVATASALHDIGKIGIDEKILNKPGRLTDEEFEIMKTHTVIGASILEKLDLYQDERLVQIAIEICRSHHERYDGRGYPDGLKGDEIPISAQVVSVADVYDALTSERVYKHAYSHEKAMDMIFHGECGAFNPMILECLKEIQDQLKNM